MKIKELSQISGINPETIRLYRNKGLLFPTQSPNGYYDYSIKDYISLVYIRKMREYAVPLDDIHAYCNSTNTDEMLAFLDKNLKDLDMQIELLKEQKEYLNYEKEYIVRGLSQDLGGVQITQSVDDKIDVYDFYKSNSIKLQKKFYKETTPSIYVDKDILNGPIVDKIIPIKAGYGTFRYMIENTDFVIPEDAVICPNGLYISQMIKLQNLNSINILELSPMMSYAKEHNLTFISSTTGYLLRVEHTESSPVFHFRIRACFEENNNKSRL